MGKEDWRWKILAKNSLFACYHVGMPNPGGTMIQFTSYLFSMREPEADTHSLVLWRESPVFSLGGGCCFEYLNNRVYCSIFQMLIQTMQLSILRIPRGLWRIKLSNTWSQVTGNGCRNPWSMKRLFG